MGMRSHLGDTYTRFSVGVTSIAIGTILGAFAGAKAAGAVGVLIGIPLASAGIYTIATLIIAGSGRLAHSVVIPSGKSTPAKRDFSLAKSYVVRGRYEDAISAYEVACAELPEDPEPYVRLARLYRDKLNQYDDALAWFKRARTEAKPNPGMELLITQEIVEIYRSKLNLPAKAIPELARLAERYANTPDGNLARRELEKLRAEIHSQG